MRLPLKFLLPAAAALSLTAPMPARADALKGAAIGAGVGILVGGGGKAARNGAIAGAIIGGVSKNKRKR